MDRLNSLNALRQEAARFLAMLKLHDMITAAIAYSALRVPGQKLLN